ncbi:MAG: LptA/OstA family protein [Candidatus Aminicenantales bacterium]
MWQSKKTLAAESVRLDEETGRLFCSGEVKSIIPYRHKGREEERLEVSAETMSFEPEENVISFTQKSSLRLKNIHLRSRSIYIHLKEKNGEMEKIVARGKVVVVQDEKQGQGQEGIYEFEEEALTLLGNPVLIDKDKGRIRGDKLTFHMSDGRIVVENKDRERSVTVIKS